MNGRMQQYIEGAVPLQTYLGNCLINVQQNFRIQASESNSTDKTFTDIKINRQQRSHPRPLNNESTSFLMAQAIFEPNLFPYYTPTLTASVV
jgi:hypothetical protein